MRVIRSLLIAFSTYSRIPVPQAEWTEENRRYSMCFFPLIGAVIGAAMALWLWLCQRLALNGLLQGGGEDLAVAIEDEFEVEIPDREALGIETVGDVMALIEKYLA